MTNTINKEKIIEHYDLISPYYHSLWGEHLHHGYWITGNESKEEAQIALVEHLAKAANIKPGCRVFDIGCGFGASSIYLAKKYNAQTLGITISQVQVQVAQEDAVKACVESQFIFMDAEAITLDESFDVIWSIESISHYQNKPAFFNKAVQLLELNGVIAIIDWFKKEHLSAIEYRKYIAPIEKGMLVELYTMNDYASLLQSNGIQIVEFENISTNSAKTWSIALSIIKNKMFWQLALENGKEFINFLRSFRSMKKGFASGAFVYGMIIGKKSDIYTK